jgi:hypothetical protein
MQIRVYSRQGFITYIDLTSPHVIEQHEILIEEGWLHTATIDPAAWIKALMNGSSENISDMMDELNFGPCPNHPVFNKRI